MPEAPRFQARPAPRGAASIEDTYLHVTGFREYDARWFLDRDINLRGLTRVGRAFGALLRRMDPSHQEVLLGHDYRAYSQAAAHAVGLGLVGAGLDVVDLGLATTPMAYFAQHLHGIRALAQITASHNENGWTGVKMGFAPSRTLGPEEMAVLRDIALCEDLPFEHGGAYRQIQGVREAYLEDLLSCGPLRQSRRVVLATGHGTAGHVAPEALERAGCEVVRLHTDLDWDFPHGNPNPESEDFLRRVRDAVNHARVEGPALGICLDGDGDRLGVVDEAGRSVYSDKVGLLLARWMAKSLPDPLFVFDIKSTSLVDDPAVLPARVHWEKTGHSYIKRAVAETGAHAGFERSGHFFLVPPFGRGYDDGLLSALLLLRMLDETERSLCDLLDELPPTWQSPNFQPHVDDTLKYAVVDAVLAALAANRARGERLAGRPISRLLTLNGVKAVRDDGSWLLVRASSNRPSLVVMAESPEGPDAVDALIEAAAGILSHIEGVAPLDASTAH